MRVVKSLVRRGLALAVIVAGSSELSASGWRCTQASDYPAGICYVCSRPIIQMQPDGSAPLCTQYLTNCGDGTERYWISC